MPQDLASIVSQVIAIVDPQTELQFGIHTHNDCELAVANAIAAVTSGVTRVLVESSNGIHRWTTIGVSDNILEAFDRAVAQEIEYGLLVKSPQTCSLGERYEDL